MRYYRAAFVSGTYTDDSGKEKNRWHELGAAWLPKEFTGSAPKSISVKLNSIPAPKNGVYEFALFIKGEEEKDEEPPF